MKRGPNLKEDIDVAVEKMVNDQLLDESGSEENEEECEGGKKRKQNRKALKRKINEQKESVDLDDLGDIPL